MGFVVLARAAGEPAAKPLKFKLQSREKSPGGDWELKVTERDLDQ